MSMRIITPLGKLCVVKKAVPLVSKQFEFNSSDRFLCEVCKEEGIANGIALDIGDKDRFIVSGVDDIGQIHGRFLSGGSMAIIPEVDKFKIVTEKQ